MTRVGLRNVLVRTGVPLTWLSTSRATVLFEDCVEDSPLRYELSRETAPSVGG